MPTLDVERDDAPADRFTRIGETWLDLSAVVAVTAAADGFELHLSGGQAVALPSSVAAGVLRKLGLPVPRQKAKGKRRKAKAPVAGAGLVATIASFFSS